MTRWLAVIVLLSGIAVALAGAWVLPLETAEAYVAENGPIELATAFVWFTLTLTLLLLALTGRQGMLFCGFITALAGGREFDLQGAMTDEAVVNLRYWTRSGPPLSEKLLVALTLLALLTIFLVGVRRHWRDFANALTAGQGHAWSIVTMILATPLLMLADGAARYYKDFTGGILDPSIHILTLAIEETGELMLPVIGLVALGQYFARAEAGQGSASRGAGWAMERQTVERTEGA